MNEAAIESVRTMKNVTARNRDGLRARISDDFEIASLAELLSFPAGSVGPLDIARANLLCAQDLPGAEHLDVPACLATVDRWARGVKLFTSDNRHLYYEKPHEYEHHQGLFRFLIMANFLKHPNGIVRRKAPARAWIVLRLAAMACACAPDVALGADAPASAPFTRVGIVEGTPPHPGSPLSRDGRVFLTQTGQSAFRAWKTDTLEPASPLISVRGEIAECKLVSNGSRVFLLTSDECSLRNASSGDVVWRIELKKPLFVADVSDDGKLVATIPEQPSTVASLWRGGEERQLKEFRHGHAVISVQFDSSIRWILSHEFLTGFRVWSLETGVELFPMIASEDDYSVPGRAQFAAHGDRLAIPTMSGLVVVELPSGKALFRASWDASLGGPTSVGFLGDTGRKIVVSMNGGVAKLPVRVYDVETRRLEHELPVGRFLGGDKSGRWALCSSREAGNVTATLWDMSAGASVQSFVRARAGATFSGRMSDDGSVILIEEVSGKTAVWRRKAESMPEPAKD
jgi:hypothetical protein